MNALQHGSRPYKISPSFLLAILFFSLMTGFKAHAENSSQRLDPKSQEIADELWGKILTNCDGDYCYGGSNFEVYIFGTETGAARANRGLTEYSGVHFLNNAMPISAANVAEGVQHKGLTAMLPTKWRERTPNQNTWESWISPKSGSDPLALTQILMEAHGHLGSAGAMTIEIWEVKGQWYYVLPPETVPERQSIPIDKISRKMIACGPLKNDGAGGDSGGLPPLVGPTETTRDLTDLKPNVPPDCVIPKGTEVIVQHVYSDTGELDIFVPGTGQRAGKQCPNNFLKVERADVQPKRLNAVKPVGVIAANVTETEPKTPGHRARDRVEARPRFCAAGSGRNRSCTRTTPTGARCRARGPRTSPGTQRSSPCCSKPNRPGRDRSGARESCGG